MESLHADPASGTDSDDALTRHLSNQSRAAQSVGLTLRQFGYRLKKAGLR